MKLLSRYLIQYFFKNTYSYIESETEEQRLCKIDDLTS